MPYRILILVATAALFPGLTGRTDGAEPEPPAGTKSTADARPPEAEPEFAFIIADLRGLPAGRLFADPEKCPAFRDLAREGLAVVSLSSPTSGPQEPLRTLVGAGETGLFQRAAGKHRPGRIWLLSPRANRETVELAAGARLFAPDVRLPPYWSLLRR